MNLGSNLNKKKRKGEVQNKTKWKNSFGGKRLSGGKKSRRKKGKEKRTKNRGKIFSLRPWGSSSWHVSQNLLVFLTEN